MACIYSWWECSGMKQIFFRSRAVKLQGEWGGRDFEFTAGENWLLCRQNFASGS